MARELGIGVGMTQRTVAAPPAEELSLPAHSSGIQNGRLRTPPIGSWST
jgi:hypothetical protein